VSAVDIRLISKTYGSVVALDDVSLTFADGEFFGLLGPSGSGKTTLLRSIAGFVQPDRGEIRISGEDISRVPIYRRDIGMVFQNYALFPHMSVYDNIAFGLSVRNIASSEIRTRVNDALKLVQLEGFGGRRPRQLSGGQQQRIALARAIVSRPRVLLLDEPLGALDKNLRQQMQIELKQIQRVIGITTVLVTHDQEEALTLSDRIAVFNQGKVVQTGTPNDIYEKPQTAFVASFLGAANFLLGKVVGPSGSLTLVEVDGGHRILVPASPLKKEGERTRVVVRPEKIAIASANTALVNQQANVVAGTIAQTIFMGPSITYKVRCGETELTVFQQNREAEAHDEGAAVTLSWAPQDASTIAV
jgi:spermidine/putrescine ABC transporter ATP-binding subunit